jgi:predicted dehydrogenase
MSVFSRREFLHRTAVLSAASATLGGTVLRAADSPAKSGSANDRLKVAVVGVKGRGMSHVGGFLDKGMNCEIVAVCDADEAVIGPAMKKVKDVQGAEPKFVQDFRKLLEDNSIDIITIATPNHWHATMAVWAMRAGKHVYCEKPATHNVKEGRLMAEAMAGTKKLCQVGTQSRSNPGMRQAIQFLHDGKLGKVQMAYGTCYKPRKSIGKVEKPTEPPKSLNYDLWCGPAAVLPVTRKSLHYDWHWTWEYGNGDFGNQGVHEADKARWGLGAKGLPKSAVAVGGRWGYIDDGETPNTQLCLFEYAEGPLMFETRGLDTKDILGAKVGNIWFCENGYVVCPSYSGGVAYTPDGKEVAKFGGGGDQHHFRNFIDAVRAGDAAKLNCPAEEGHASAAICHLGNISYRLGQKASLADAITCFDGNEKAKDAFGRMKEHVASNKVELKEAIGMVGAKLTLDPKTEAITDAGGADKAKANALLFREYRKGFDIQKGA